MRDKLNVFGDAVCATSGTAVEAPDIIENFSNVQTVGYEKNVNITARPSRAILDDETVTIELLEAETDTGTYKPSYTYNTIGSLVLPGDPIKFSFPRLTKQFIKAKATVTKGVAAYASCTVNIAIEIG